MEEKAVRGVPWTLVGYAANKVITVTTTLTLAALLAPDDFGVVALAMIVVHVLNMVGDMGMAATLVLRQDLTRRDQGTLLSMMIAMGGAMAAVGIAIAPLMAVAFDEPRVDEVLVLMSLSALLVAPTWFYEGVLQRELEFRKRFMALGAQSLTNAAVALGLAVAGAGVYSIVAGQLLGIAAYGATLATLSPYRVRPAFDRSKARDLFGTGTGFLAQTSMGFLREQGVYFIIGRLLGAGPLGIFSVAFRIGDLTYAGLADPIAKVTFPAFSRARHRGEDITDSFLSVLRLIALVAVPAAVLLSATSEPFVEALFSDKWLGMIGPLLPLGIWAAIRPVETTIGWLLNSIGEARRLARAAAVLLAFFLPAVFVAAWFGDLTAVAWVVLADRVVALFVIGELAHRLGDVPRRGLVRSVQATVIAAVPTWIAAYAVSSLLADAPSLLALSAGVAAGVIAYAAALAVVAPGLMRDSIALAKRTIARGREEDEPKEPAPEPASPPSTPADASRRAVPEA